MFKAGLFSAFCAVCLAESYERLSQNSGDEAVKLITQVSQQLSNISHGIHLESIAADSSEPLKRTRSAVMVNLSVTWFASIIISIGCAAFVTLIQQWARRYLAFTQRRGTPYERALLRRFLLYSLRRFHVPVDRVYQSLGAFMHLSLLFYCVGLATFIFHIDWKLVSESLAIGYISCSFLIYAITMVSPFIFLDCPYGTPFTALTWRLYHLFMLGFFSTILGITDLPHTLSTIGSLTYQHVSGSRSPSQWRKMLEERVNWHRRRLSVGRKRRVELYATRFPRVADATAHKCTLPDPAKNNSDKEVEDFALWVLEFFDTYARSGAEETILPLMSEQSPTDHTFGFRLHRLLKICILGTSALTEDSEQRRRRLRECLECLWCWARAYNQSSASLPSYFPLPNPDMIRRLQAEQDPTAAIIARCFGALVANKLAADINSRRSSDVRVHDTKLESLSAILGSPRTDVETFLRQPGAIGLANIASLTSSVMKTLFTKEVPSEVLSIFRTTVDILLADSDDSLTSLDAKLPENLVSFFHKTYANAQRPQAPDWLRHQLWPISEMLFMVPCLVDAT